MLFSVQVRCPRGLDQDLQGRISQLLRMPPGAIVGRLTQRYTPRPLRMAFDKTYRTDPAS